jgi:hypothetical protein
MTSRTRRVKRNYNLQLHCIVPFLQDHGAFPLLGTSYLLTRSSTPRLKNGESNMDPLLASSLEVLSKIAKSLNLVIFSKLKNI